MDLLNFLRKFYYGTGMLLLACCVPEVPGTESQIATVIHQDTAFWQDYSIKYDWARPDDKLRRIACDRNGIVQVLADGGLFLPHGGEFLHPGELRPDLRYRTSRDKQFAGLTLHEGQFVYLDRETVLSHAWAGRLFIPHQLPGARLVAGGEGFTFLVSDGRTLHLADAESVSWRKTFESEAIIDLQYDPSSSRFFILTDRSLLALNPDNQSLETLYTGTQLTAFTLLDDGSRIALGSTNGYLLLDSTLNSSPGEWQRKTPATGVTAIREIEGSLWFGTTQGVFKLREDGGYDYYFGARWLPGDEVVDIAAGEGGSVLVLTDGGLAVIRFQPMTLQQKADFYEAQVRKRHIRLGFNASLRGLDRGDLRGGYLSDSDNDGLWTAMYLGAEVFRYAVTSSPEALQNCRESLDAMERLYTINPVPGFPARSFERSGYIEELSDPHRWQHASDPEWDWKATTSSDEAIGHMFAFGVVAELIEEEALRSKAVLLMDSLMQHILDNDLYLVDYDGKPTTWGKWNPEYVNARPEMVGDRKLNSSNIISMLQTAYHFTGKAQYRTKAFELMEQYGYLENLLRPFSEIGPAPDSADDWSKMLSENWNHSDDEMYFLGYWGLYHYAFNDSLRALYREAIIDHWEMERPEKEGAWNIFTAITGKEDIDLAAAIWYLQEYPLDLISWEVRNSHRKDIEPVPPNFRGQTIRQVLPPDELPISRHNTNRFRLDGGDGGRSEFSAGDIWLLPYWMGRYLGRIGGEENR